MRFWCQLRLIYLCACSPTILDKSPRDTTAIFIFFCHFSGSLLKQCIIFEIFLQFTLPHPIQSWNSGKNLDTRVQHCLWGEGRGWTCVNWKTPQKRKSVPRLLSMIVATMLEGVALSFVWVHWPLVIQTENWSAISPFSKPFLFILFYFISCAYYMTERKEKNKE